MILSWESCIHNKPYLSSLVVNNFFGGQVRLVAHKQLVHILTSISVNLIQPLLHIVETLLVCDIIDHLQQCNKIQWWAHIIGLNDASIQYICMNFERTNIRQITSSIRQESYSCSLCDQVARTELGCSYCFQWFQQLNQHWHTHLHTRVKHYLHKGINI